MFQPVFLVCLKTLFCLLSPFPLKYTNSNTQAELNSIILLYHFSMKHSILSSGERDNNTFKISFADIILWETWHRFMYLLDPHLGSLSAWVNIDQKAFFIFWTSTNQTGRLLLKKQDIRIHWEVLLSDAFPGPENDPEKDICPSRDSKILL